MWKVVWTRTIESTGPICLARKSQPLGFSLELVPFHHMGYQRSLWCIIIMMVTRRFKPGSGSGSRVGNQDRHVSSEDRVSGIIREGVIDIVPGTVSGDVWVY